MPNGNCLFGSTSSSLLGNSSLEHERTIMAAIELHLNAIHYVPNPALKSVYKKKQSVMGGKFSFSYRKVFGQYLMNMKMAHKFAELFH